MNLNSLFTLMERYAKEANVPIMLKEGIDYLQEFVRNKNIKNTLEIGTAIGYSALKIASMGSNVVTIERDEERYKKAVEYINQTDLKDKISLIFDDALNVKLTDKFDLIFIDAAKAQNINFINNFKDNLKDDGFIIIDNVGFHGLVGKSDEIASKNLRALVRKIEKFLDYLDNQDEFKVTKINVGDGLILLERK